MGANKLDTSVKKEPVDQVAQPAPVGDEYLKSIVAYKVNADQYAGTVAANGKEILPVFDPNGGRDVQDQIDTGNRTDVSDGIITYGFFTGNHAVGINNNPQLGEGKGYTPFTAEQKAATVKAMETWDDLIAAKFVNVGDVSVKGWAQGQADILLANSTTGPNQAWAYQPGGTGVSSRISSDVWIMNPEVQWDNGAFGFGQYGFATLVHEIGHTLGFSHPGEYNGAAARTYELDASYFQDSGQYTIMSYWSPSETGARMWDFQNNGGLLDVSAQTPLLHDIALIQAKYGADPTTRVGDTVYGFNSTAGNALYDFSQNVLPNLAIYDAGGIDTIDLSGFTISQVVDLEPGAFSSIGSVNKSYAQMGADLAQVYFNYTGIDLIADVGYTSAQLAGLSQGWVNSTRVYAANSHAAETGVTGLYTIAYDNVAIAYNTVIENATGGSSRDLLQGNSVANVLKGLDGSDVLDGRGGNDTLLGGNGNDVLIGGAGADTLTGGAGNDIFSFDQLTGDLGNVITDFSATDLLDFGALDIDLSFIGNGSFSGGGNAELSYIAGLLSGDFNGDGTADFSVALTGTPMILETQILGLA